MNPVTQPFSMMGAGMPEDADEQQLSAMLPSGGMALPPGMMPPQMPINPGMAAGSGMLAGLAGQQGNPYIQQTMQMQQQSDLHQRGMMRSMAYMQQQQLAAQAQQLRQKAMLMRQEQAKQAHELRRQELVFKGAQELLRGSDPNGKRLGDEALRSIFKSQGVDVPPGHFIGGQANQFKEHEIKDIRLQLAAGVPPQEIIARYPAATPEWLTAEYKIVTHPRLGKALGIAEEVDPVIAAQKSRAEQTERWMKEHQFDRETMIEAAPMYRQRFGRDITSAGPDENPVLEQIRKQAQDAIRRRKLEDSVDLAVLKMQARDREKREQEQDQIPAKELPFWVNKKTHTQVDPNTPWSEIRQEHVRLSAQNVQAVNQAQSVHKYLQEISEIAARNPMAIWGSQFPGSGVLSQDAARVQSLRIALPQAVRAFGEVGNLTASERAEALNAIAGLATAEGYQERVKTVLGLLNRKLKNLNIDPLVIDFPDTRKPSKSGPLSVPEPPPGGRKVN